MAAAASDTPPARGSGNATAATAVSPAGLVQYLRDVQTELKKAEWPSRPEMIRLTEIVLLLIVIVAAYCGALDGILSFVTGRLFGSGGH